MVFPKDSTQAMNDGPKERTSMSDNIPFTAGIGDEVEMWNKVKKEVQLGRYAGPFKKIPYQSLNYFTPDEICTPCARLHGPET